MIAILVFLASSESIKLTAANMTAFLHNEEHRPVFLKAWASWCPHCKEMAPAWEELANLPKFQDKVYFADIECESNRKACHTLPGENYPRLYWVDYANNDTMFRYEGSRKLKDMEFFVTKQFNFPLMPVKQEEILDIVIQTNRSTTFVFTIDPNDDISLNIARMAVASERNSSSPFLLLNGEPGSKPQLMCYSGSTEVTFEYKGHWLVDKINHFIALRTIRFLRSMDGYVLRYAENRGFRVLILISNSSEPIPNEIRELAVQASYHTLVAYTHCNESSWFCRYTDIHPQPGNPTFVIYARAEKLFWIYDNKTEFFDWLMDVLNGKIEGQGPGTGWLNLIKKVFYDAKADGRPPPYLIFVVPIIFIIIVVYIFCDITNLNASAKHKEE